jgi:adenylate cyclase
MIRVKGRDEPLASSPAVSLLNLLQRSGVPIQTVCGGRAQCGRCLVRVLSGGRNLSPQHEAERRRLEALKAGPDMRLACQSFTRGDVEIQIINPATPTATA